MTRASRGAGRSRGALVAIFVLGVGVAVAPLLFSMFSRAPKGKEMIDEFRPFMTPAQVAKFRGYLDTIGAAADEARDDVDPAAAASLGLDAVAYEQRVVLLHDFEQRWPGIDADMSEMLDRMDRNLENYAGVDALPPFTLFPWFFVIPGLLIAGLAGWALVRTRRGERTRGLVVALGILGVGLIAAPAIFQMFTRAPGGKEMIDDFRPLMTREKVTTIQGYFVVIGAGEAELRNVAVPASGLAASDLPAATELSEQWPTINSEMAPMVGVMADNVENFEAVDALPAFSLFPWFFVIPGVLIAGLAVVAWRAGRDPAVAPTDRPKEAIHMTGAQT